jgi:predicted RNase H-like HicB family nuclease
MRCAVVIERTRRNFSAFVPELAGCVATGATRRSVEKRIREAIEFHLDGLREDRLPIPCPTSVCDYVEVVRAAG